MRVLLDESLPRPLAKLVTGHEVRTVTEMKWTGLGNGELLLVAAGRFDVVLTADQNIEFQRPAFTSGARDCVGADWCNAC
ncbi:MAG: DUF5615 family PIN-like protein [Vicinamibacterales bacterium]